MNELLTSCTSNDNCTYSADLCCDQQSRYCIYRPVRIDCIDAVSTETVFFVILLTLICAMVALAACILGIIKLVRYRTQKQIDGKMQIWQEHQRGRIEEECLKARERVVYDISS